MSDGPVQYRILSLVGEGGFGRVYRARLEDGEGFSKDVAIKLLNDPEPPKSLLERFRDEARILGLIRDRAIVGVEPPVQLGNRWAVVMDFVDGASCGTVLDQGCIPPGVSIEIVGEVARALHSAYQQEGPEGQPLQLLHRDIKPENIQITPNGDVRVLDFGIARANFAAREYKTRHALGGTPGYIAPERLDGVEVATGDVYSLGVVLHELVCGERPAFPPTINLETLDQDAPAPFGAPQGIHVDAEDLELHEKLQGDPHVLAVLRLAAWMRTQDPAKRPAARQVEEACRDLRQRLPEPYFRNWAEQQVPRRVEMQADKMVGQILSRTSGGASGAPSRHTGATIRPATGAGNTGQTERLAIGAMLGGGVVLGLAGFLVLLVASGIGLVLYLQPPSPLASTAAPEPTPTWRGEAIQFDEDAAAEVAPTPDPGPSTIREAPRDPVPSPVAQPNRRVLIPVPSAAPVTAPDDEPDYVPDFPVRKKPTGTVLVTTVPTGATVWEDGTKLSAVAPRRYEMPIGAHRLKVMSASGADQTYLPVIVKEGEIVSICYDFDQDRACGGTP